MINFTVYSADCVGNSGNCLYPNKMIVSDKESFIKATKMDHVTAKYKGNYRSKDNFESSDCIPLDCDNDHSDNPNEWVTPLDIALEIPGVAFAVSYSRHNNLPKGDKSARPRFHIFFPIEIISDEQEYADMKRRIADAFPYYDTNALDSARFLYGNGSDEVEFYEGDKTILDYLEEDDFADFDASLEQVQEGQRNSTMSHIAGKIIKRYGNTEDAYQIFLKKVELCNPPLPESELKVIWRSASKFGNKVSNQEGYIPPEQYNSDCRLKPEDFSDVGQATVLATEYKDIIRYSPSTDYMVYNGSFWEESKPKSQGVSQDLTERQLAEAETEMKKAMDELVKNGGMEILVSVGPKKAVQMFNKQQAHAYEMYEDASVYGQAVIDEPNAERVRMLFREYIKCESMRAAAKKAGIDKTHSVIGRFLKNKVYVGTEYYPQIINENVFTKAQEIRGNNAKNQNRIGAYRPHPKGEIGTFTIGKVAVQYDNPYKQAEYAYSQIAEVANE